MRDSAPDSQSGQERHQASATATIREKLEDNVRIFWAGVQALRLVRSQS